MPVYYYPVYTALTATLTGWTGSDPDRYCCETPISIPADPDLAQTVAASVSVSYTSISGSTTTNLPDLEYESDVVGWTAARSISPGSASIPLANVSPNMSFRLANVHDAITGAFTPRTITGLNVTLALTPAQSSINFLDNFGVSSPSGVLVVPLRRQRGFAQVVG